MASGEDLVVKQPIFHSSPLPSPPNPEKFLFFFSNASPRAQSITEESYDTSQSPKIPSQNKARPLCFSLFDSTLFLKSTFGKVYIPLDIQFPLFASSQGLLCSRDTTSFGLRMLPSLLQWAPLVYCVLESSSSRTDRLHQKFSQHC